MNQMMQFGAMQNQMKEVLGDDGYSQMLEATANYGSGMQIGMANTDGMMQAMAACPGSR